MFGNPYAHIVTPVWLHNMQNSGPYFRNLLDRLRPMAMAHRKTVRSVEAPYLKECLNPIGLSRGTCLYRALVFADPVRHMCATCEFGAATISPPQTHMRTPWSMFSPPQPSILSSYPEFPDDRGNQTVPVRDTARRLQTINLSAAQTMGPWYAPWDQPRRRRQSSA